MQQAESGTVHLITRNGTGTVMEAINWTERNEGSSVLP